MAFFQTNDHERELLERYYRGIGLDGTALEEAILSAKEEIAKGKPIAYIVGEEAFYDGVFAVNEHTLIPRPDTERLVEFAIRRIPENGSFVDLGTGSGCIALTVLKHRPDLTGIAVDISHGALAVARENARRLGVEARVTFLEEDMRKLRLADGSVDFVISNPPYIPTEDIASYPSLAYEPVTALDGGKDGMDFYRTILCRFRSALTKDGAFLFEIGFDQKEAITALAAEQGMSCLVYQDYGGNDRVAYIPKPSFFKTGTE